MNSSSTMYAMLFMPPTSPITIICSCGIFLNTFASLMSLSSLSTTTCPPKGSRPGMHASTMNRSKLFHFHSFPKKYRHRAMPSAKNLSSHSTQNTPRMAMSV